MSAGRRRVVSFGAKKYAGIVSPSDDAYSTLRTIISRPSCAKNDRSVRRFISRSRSNRSAGTVLTDAAVRPAAGDAGVTDGRFSGRFVSERGGSRGMTRPGAPAGVVRLHPAKAMTTISHPSRRYRLTSCGSDSSDRAEAPAHAAREEECARDKDSLEICRCKVRNISYPML